MINVAVVGTGNIANLHLAALLTFPKMCKIVALVDIYPEKAEAMKKKYHLDCMVFDSHKKMLESGLKINLVHICTPPYVHAEIAIDSMNVGKNIVVEKPMATCLEECDRMIEAESRNGVTMACIAQNRFRKQIYGLKTVIDSKKAGKIRVIHIDSLWWRGHSYYDLWWRGLWEKEGGGPTLNHAVHHIDMLNWIQGELPSEVTAVLANVMHDNSEVEDLSLAALKYRDGSIAQLASSVVHHGEEQRLVFQCENAKVQFPWNCCAFVSRPNGFPERNEGLEKELNELYEQLPDLPYEAHTGEVDNILSAIETGTRPMITGKDGRNTIELITAIYKAGFSGKTVSLPIQKDDEYYKFSGIVKNAIHFNKKLTCVENFTDTEITTGSYGK